MIAVIAVTGVDATNKAEREHLSNDVMKNRLGSAKATSAKAKRSKSLPMVVREPDEAEKRAIAAAGDLRDGAPFRCGHEDQDGKRQNSNSTGPKAFRLGRLAHPVRGGFWHDECDGGGCRT